MPIPQWRITFDVENKMTQRPGFAQSPFGTNITQYVKSNDDEWTWQEPITGIMMLKPSYLTAQGLMLRTGTTNLSLLGMSHIGN
jgi:hypothetical protein